MKTEIRNFLSQHITDYELQDSDDFFEMGLVNSLFALQLVLFVEQTFQVSIEGEDMDFSNFRTIDAIATLVERMTAVPA